MADTKIEISKNIQYNNDKVIVGGNYKVVYVNPDVQPTQELTTSQDVEWTSVSQKVPFIPSSCDLVGTFNITTGGNNYTVIKFLKKLWISLSNILVNGDTQNSTMQDLKNAHIFSLTRYKRNDTQLSDYDNAYDFGGGISFGWNNTTSQGSITRGAFCFNFAQHFGGVWKVNRDQIFISGFNVKLSLLDQTYWGATYTIIPGGNDTNNGATMQGSALSGLIINNLRIRMLQQNDQSIQQNILTVIMTKGLRTPFDYTGNLTQSFAGGANGTTNATMTPKLTVKGCGSKVKKIHVVVYDQVFNSNSDITDTLDGSFKPCSRDLYKKLDSIEISLDNETLKKVSFSTGQFKENVNSCVFSQNIARGDKSIVDLKDLLFYNVHSIASITLPNANPKYMQIQKDIEDACTFKPSDLICIEVDLVGLGKDIDTVDYGIPIISGSSTLTVTANFTSAPSSSYYISCFYTGVKYLNFSSLGMIVE